MGRWQEIKREISAITDSPQSEHGKSGKNPISPKSMMEPPEFSHRLAAQVKTAKRAPWSLLLLWITLPLAAAGAANFATPYTFATLAGSQMGYVNGLGSVAEFALPQGVAVDGAGNLYVADSANKAVRMVTPRGVVTTLVKEGVLMSPYGVAVDSAANIYVADYTGGAIRKVSLVGTNWQVSTLATGFSAPYGVAVDAATNLYVADTGASVIQKVTRQGTNWVVTTIAGPAGFNHPCCVAVDSATNVYVAGGNSETIQRLTLLGLKQAHWVRFRIARMQNLKIL